GTAAETIRERAQARREQKLHERPSDAEHAESFGSPCGITPHEAFDQLRQDRNDYPERQHVERNGDQDEPPPPPPRPCSDFRHGCSRQITPTFCEVSLIRPH